MPLEPLAAKWAAFGWRVFVCDGHSFPELCAALDAAAADDAASGQPALIIANTVKGKGVDFMEDQPKWHYGALDSQMYARAQASLRTMCERWAV